MTNDMNTKVYKPLDLTYSPLEQAKMSTFGLLMILVFFATTIGFAVAKFEIMYYIIPIIALAYIIVTYIVKEKDNTKQYTNFIEYRTVIKAYAEETTTLVFNKEDNDEELTRFAAGEEIYRKDTTGERYAYAVNVDEETGEVSILRGKPAPVTVEDHDE